MTRVDYQILPESCETRVCWDIFSGRKPSISHFYMGAVEGCALPTKAWLDGSPIVVDEIGAEDPGNHCDVDGAKFDYGFNDCQTRRLCVAYAGIFPEATTPNTGFVVKAGMDANGGCKGEVKALGIVCTEAKECEGDGCGEGHWTCENGQGVCETEGGLNECGGCNTDVDAQLGQVCAQVGCKQSRFKCNPENPNSVICVENEFECDWFDSECATYACDEEAGSCKATLHHEQCDGFDGDLCDGGMQCSPEGKCTDAKLVECEGANGLYCDGEPHCDAGDGMCDAGEPPCPEGQCDEEANVCTDCPNGEGYNACESCGTLPYEPETFCGDACNPGAYECNENGGVTCVTTPVVCPDDKPFCSEGSCYGCLGDENCGGGVCDDGTCVDCVTDSDCNDNYDCTLDSCMNKVCKYDANPACDDECIDVGTLGELNVLVCGDYFGGDNFDVEGALAVKGSLWANNFGVGATLYAKAGIQDALIVGDTYHLGSGQVYGNAYYGKAEDIIETTNFLGTHTQGAPKGFDFVGECNAAMLASQQLSELAANGTATDSWGRIDFVGTRADLNVISVSGADVSKAHTLHVKAPAGSTVVINVSGASVDMKNAGVSTEGVGRTHVIWNLFEATNVTITGITVQGSVLAPKAAVNFTNGNVDGSLVAKRIDGNGEFHHVLFDGDVCPPEEDDGGGDVDGDGGGSTDGDVDPTPPAPAAPAGCGATATFEVFNNWGSEFQARVKLSNLAAGVTSWNVSLDLAPAPGWVGGWGAAYQYGGGTLNARDHGWNGVVGAGGTIEFYVQAPTSGGAAPTASNFKLNGVACGN